MELIIVACLWQVKKKYLIATPIFLKGFPIHAAGAVCQSTFVISTSSFSTLVGTFFAALLCVLWLGALDRLWLRAAQFVRVCSTTGYITSGLRGPSPQALNPLRRGWVYRPAPEALRKGECRRGPRHFWNCLSRWASALWQDPS